MSKYVLQRPEEEKEEEQKVIAREAVKVAEEQVKVVEGTGDIADNPAIANKIIDRSDMSTMQKKQAREETSNPEKLARSVEAGSSGQGSVKNSFMESLAFFMPQAIGAGLGALFEGSQGAVAGAEMAGKMAKEKRDYDLQVQNRQMTPYQQEQTRLREEQLKLDKQAEKRRMSGLDLARDRFGFSKEEAAQLSEKQTEAIGAFSKTLDSIDRIRALKKDVVTGPISARIQALGELVDAAPKKFTQLKSEVKSMGNQYIKAITGAQMSEAEADRLMAVVPVDTDADEVFVTKLATFEKIVERNRDAVLNAIRTGQPLRRSTVDAMLEAVDKYESAVTSKPKKKSPYGDEVTKNGKKYKWNATKGKYQLKGNK